VKLPRGVCPVCRVYVALRRGGLVREHRALMLAGTQVRCLGSGALALPYVVGTIGAGRAMHIAHATSPVPGVRAGNDALCRFGTALAYTLPATATDARERSTCALCRRVLAADERALAATRA